MCQLRTTPPLSRKQHALTQHTNHHRILLRKSLTNHSCRGVRFVLAISYTRLPASFSRRAARVEKLGRVIKGRGGGKRGKLYPHPTPLVFFHLASALDLSPPPPSSFFTSPQPLVHAAQLGPGKVPQGSYSENTGWVSRSTLNSTVKTTTADPRAPANGSRAAAINSVKRANFRSLGLSKVRELPISWIELIERGRWSGQGKKKEFVLVPLPVISHNDYAASKESYSRTMVAPRIPVTNRVTMHGRFHWCWTFGNLQSRLESDRSRFILPSLNGFRQ